jgi:thioredoxin 1
MAEVLTDANFDEATQEGVVLIDFYADWCGPCRMVAPIIEELSNELEEGKIVKVNVDESPEVSRKFMVRSIPTIVVLKDGEEFSRQVGASPDKGFYKNMIVEAL